VRYPIFETFLFKISCSAVYVFMFFFILFLLIVPHSAYIAISILLLSIILIILSIIFYTNYSKDRLSSFEDMILKKAKKSLSLGEDIEVLKLSKKGKVCLNQLKKKTRIEYELSFIFLADNYLTIATGCPKFNIFKLARHGRDKKWAVKDACGNTREYRYSYIQSTHYNGAKKSLDLVLTSGFVEHIACDKPVADKAIIKIREKLRNTERGVQTNFISS